MNDIAIQVENIGKRFYIGHQQKGYKTLRDTLADVFIAPFRKAGNLLRGHATGAAELEEEIWALEDVSFNVNRGEVIGIIGRNGAGKSTLLKILSRITEPSKGYVEIRGRVGSLLEVGTGFHPELTGRDNVFLNGAILGMKRNEIEKKFDEIVDFAEMDKFIDTPVKHYSSGMYLRLAFGVAAHMEPEILIIDEVLAVGDAQFQAKCLGKMNSVAKEGRTVLLVSHNMGAITSLCKRAIWLDGGRVRSDGPSFDVVSDYTASGGSVDGVWISNSEEESPGRLAYLKHARVLDGNTMEASTLFRYEEQIKIELTYEIKRGVYEFKCYVFLRDAFGNTIWATQDTDGMNERAQIRQPGVYYYSTCTFPGRLLRPGKYFVMIGIVGKPKETVEEERPDALSFQISDAGYPFSQDPRMGILTPCFDWKILRAEEKQCIKT